MSMNPNKIKKAVVVVPSLAIADEKVLILLSSWTVPVPKSVLGKDGTLGSAHRIDLDHHADGAGLRASSNDVKNT